jgi:hypothetical protein
MAKLTFRKPKCHHLPAPKLADTSSEALSTAPAFIGGKAVSVVLTLFMAMLSFRGIDTPTLQVQGEQRRSFFFNIPRDNSCVNGRLAQWAM